MAHHYARAHAGTTRPLCRARDHEVAGTRAEAAALLHRLRRVDGLQRERLPAALRRLGPRHLAVLGAGVACWGDPELLAQPQLGLAADRSPQPAPRGPALPRDHHHDPDAGDPPDTRRRCLAASSGRLLLGAGDAGRGRLPGHVRRHVHATVRAPRTALPTGPGTRDRHRRSPGDFMNDDEAGTSGAFKAATGRSLEDSSGADQRRYRAFQMSLIEPHCGTSLLEVGAGLGEFASGFHGLERHVVTDVDPGAVAAMAERFAGRPEVEARVLDLAEGAIDVGNPLSTIVAINVLEHLADDIGALRTLARMTEPGGRILLWVPAYMQLYGDFDRAVGHLRRYTPRTMT